VLRTNASQNETAKESASRAMDYFKGKSCLDVKELKSISTKSINWNNLIGQLQNAAAVGHNSCVVEIGVHMHSHQPPSML